MRPSKLKRALFEAGLRHVDVAQAVGVSESAFNRYVNGRRRAPEAVMVRVAAALGVPLASLVEEDQAA
jgi:transcriptional regulator with XRE-family HTH domain